MEILKMLSTSEVVAQIISFLTLFFILRFLFWKRLLRLLDERKERIASELKRIDEEKGQAQKARADYEEKLKEIENVARAKIKEAILESEKIKQELRERARVEAIKIIENAKKDAQTEIAKAKGELKNQIIDLVLEATETVLEEKITDEEDRRLVTEFLGKLDKIK